MLRERCQWQVVGLPRFDPVQFARKGFESGFSFFAFSAGLHEEKRTALPDEQNAAFGVCNYGRGNSNGRKASGRSGFIRVGHSDFTGLPGVDHRLAGGWYVRNRASSPSGSVSTAIMAANAGDRKPSATIWSIIAIRGVK